MSSNMIYRVREVSKEHPSWSNNAVLYELNTRQFTNEGTFKAAEGHLERLKSLGVDIIWMMPIFPIGQARRKGSLGSYYSIVDYTAVNSEFGTLADFKSFVARAHSLGMYVIVDWVANHTARDAKWVIQHQSWYEWDSVKNEVATPFDWDDTAKLDYSNQEMRQEMLNSMLFWLQEAKIDGFRCDMAMLVPIDFWESATIELTREMESQSRELFMLAEAEGPEFHKAFDATYSWEEHHILNRIAKGEANCYALGERLGYENSVFPLSAQRMHFTSNHDENSWNGSALERMGDAAEALAALTFLLSGMPLIYNGQECGLNRRLEFFEKDPINWEKMNSTRGKQITALYSKLSELKHSHPALLAGNLGGDIEAISNSEPWRVFAIKRKVGSKIVVGLFNLCDQDIDVEFYDDDFSGSYTNAITNEGVDLSGNEHREMKRWSFEILSR